MIIVKIYKLFFNLFIMSRELIYNFKKIVKENPEKIIDFLIKVKYYMEHNNINIGREEKIPNVFYFNHKKGIEMIIFDDLSLTHYIISLKENNYTSFYELKEKLIDVYFSLN